MTLVLWSLSTLASLVYGLHFTFLQTSWAKTIVKTIPVAAFAVLSWSVGGGALLTGALVLGAIGDLTLSRDGDRNFLIGLVAFLFGHLLYILLFLGAGSVAFALPSENWRWFAMGLVIILGVGTYLKLYPAFGALRLPVLLYVIVSLGLGFVALGQPDGDAMAWAVVGALLFILSDIVLAFDLFGDVETERTQRLLAVTVWFSYWGGQCLILVGMLGLA